jgi:hypothetical protein
MTSNSESYRIAFRVSDKQFVVRDNFDNDVFQGDYRQVESWLDQRENSLEPAMSAEDDHDSETDIADKLLEATIITQEMMEKVLSPDPAPTSPTSMISGNKKKAEK